MSDELISRVCAVVAKTQHLPAERVTADSTFEELGMDSMDAVNLLFELENEFDISIPDADARAIRTVRQLADGVDALIQSKAAGSGP